jgi:hypothetical protein
MQPLPPNTRPARTPMDATREPESGVMRHRFRSRVRARKPVEWPALGVGDRQDEHVLLVLFERDHVGEALDGRLADQGACGPRARPCRIGFWAVANSTEGSRNLGDELVAQSWARSSYKRAALRSSARASGCSSRRTSLFEFLQDLGPRGVPADRLSVTFSDLSRTPFQLGRPCRGDFLVRLLQTGKQFLCDTSAVNASQAQGLGKQLVRRHDVILAFAPENRL